MNRPSVRIAVTLLVVLAVTSLVIAQGGRRRYRGRDWDREVRPEELDRGGVPVWANDERFKDDVFTFVRVRYGSGGGWGRGGRWDTDYPDADLNFSYRLQELTSLKTDPYGKVLELSDEKIFDYPFLYLIEPGRMWLEDNEVENLRRYCLNGGFLMVDDFWGDYEWANFEENIERVFPDRKWVELPLEHEIFHTVYDLKKKPQVPSIHSDWESGYTTDRPWDPSCIDVHYRGIFDDKGRMMVIICHNTDVGDGWEREGLSQEYFKLYSEKWSYPMGINIVVYAMTH
jgi:hypothetical protein